MLFDVAVVVIASLIGHGDRDVVTRFTETWDSGSGITDSGASSMGLGDVKYGTLGRKL